MSSQADTQSKREVRKATDTKYLYETPFDANSNPVEATLHDMVYNRDSPPNKYIIPYRRWSLVPNDPNRFYLHTDWAPHGDLEDIIHSAYQEDRKLPEPMIWYYFQAMTEAANTKKNIGVIQPSELEMVHLDIKPGNFFIGSRDSEYYSDFPIPRLGDFGLAWIGRRDDAQNPSAILDRGTPGFSAPEQYDGFALGVKMLSKTNVYQIGATIWLMMRSDRLAENPLPAWERPAYLQVPLTNYTLLKTQQLPAGGASEYSEELNNLVFHCTRKNVGDRISLADLRARLQECTDLLAMGPDFDLWHESFPGSGTAGQYKQQFAGYKRMVQDLTVNIRL
ncbi:hypothetical protein LTS18_005001 [Coniosporium uncinatum]|uniref:Uncharacterized protein n=1 Tax=Coniosporium uncinatum TaxID=93489 RepID=A0ACC3D554_9PEZI|nr:hypothetical protein LTS18_005001 [Coniosporium uncinatum]